MYGTGRQECNRTHAQNCMNAAFVERTIRDPCHRCLLCRSEGAVDHIGPCEPLPGLTILNLRPKLSNDRCFVKRKPGVDPTLFEKTGPFGSRKTFSTAVIDVKTGEDP